MLSVKRRWTVDDLEDLPEDGNRYEVIDGRRPERFEDVGKLLLAVEVLSPSTARADRVAKRVLFRDEGVGEYWIIDLDARTIERSTPADPRVEVLDDRLEWHPLGAESPFVLDVAEYFFKVLEQ